MPGGAPPVESLLGPPYPDYATALRSRRPRIERVPPRVQVCKLLFDGLRTVERVGNHRGRLLVEFLIRDRRAECPLLGLERLDAGGQVVVLAPLPLRQLLRLHRDAGRRCYALGRSRRGRPGGRRALTQPDGVASEVPLHPAAAFEA